MTEDTFRNKTMTTFRLGNVQHGLLCEALRRFECFAVRRDGRKWTPDDLLRAWTGLGTRSEYRPVIDAGLMQIASCTAPRCIGWWSLTETGAEIVLAWHEAGFGCGNGYELTAIPPRRS
jgi:hypothetical protein